MALIEANRCVCRQLPPARAEGRRDHAMRGTRVCAVWPSVLALAGRAARSVVGVRRAGRLPRAAVLEAPLAVAAERTGSLSARASVPAPCAALRAAPMLAPRRARRRRVLLGWIPTNCKTCRDRRRRSVFAAGATRRGARRSRSSTRRSRRSSRAARIEWRLRSAPRAPDTRSTLHPHQAEPPCSRARNPLLASKESLARRRACRNRRMACRYECMMPRNSTSTQPMSYVWLESPQSIWVFGRN